MGRNAALGRYGEDLAARFLDGEGIVVLQRNWRCRDGEIDIIARDGDTLVICEVKTRSSLAFGHPAEAITARKLRRLRGLAASWLIAHGVHAPRVRIDVVSVLMAPVGEPRIDHLRGVEGQ